jgi:DNA-binding Lrp family transcriptional regulator
MVYITLCCHANKEGITFIGCRKISELLGISKDTASKSIRKLEASSLIRRLDNNRGRLSHIQINSVLSQPIQPSYFVGHKDNNKEFIKEEGNKKEKIIKKYNGRQLAKDAFYKHFQEKGKSPEIRF